MRPHGITPKYDGYSRSGLALYEERLAIYSRDGGRCQTCGDMVDINSFTVAHKIAATKCNYKRFGAHIIDHRLNKATTHAGRCNDRQNIGNNPGKCAEMIRQIEERSNHAEHF
jgi:hypothetical protein